MLHTRWAHSMTGEEYARIYSWGNDPKRMVSCLNTFLQLTYTRQLRVIMMLQVLAVTLTYPRQRLGPILVRHAVLNGFTCRFDTTFLSFEREPSGHIISKVQDNLTKQIYHIKSKYLVGADGARSQVLRQLQIPLIKRPGQGLAINILVKVDLSNHVMNRMGNLHWIM
jgi:2-polyprenyl-6-methoxyphenol hydroxylase-like FAD-dependent oxidoreductase